MYTIFIKKPILSNYINNFINKYITPNFNYFFSCFNKNMTVYVLYEKNMIIDNIELNWNYYEYMEDFPYNWKYNGTNSLFNYEYSKYNDITYDMNTKYSHYDVFIGPKFETESMIDYLDNYFSTLKNEKKIFRYLIQDTYLKPEEDNIFVVPLFDIQKIER
jgi:hypothetical protein